MSPIHAILIVIIRLWAAGVVIQSLLNFPAAFLFSPGDLSYQPGLASYYLTMSAIWVAAGVAAWFLAPRFSQRAYRHDRKQTPRVDVGLEDLVSIESFLIGASYVAGHLPAMVADVSVLLFEGDQQKDAAASSISRERIIKDGLITGIALFMALKPTELARLFSSVRQAGLSKPDGSA